MVQPLALVVYEQLLPGSRLVNLLQDLGYRVHVLDDPRQLVSTAREVKPLLVLMDLRPTASTPPIGELRADPQTQHLPVVGFAPDERFASGEITAPDGVTLMVSHTAIMSHLPQLLERALQVD